jgi:hypothetical protein
MWVKMVNLYRQIRKWFGVDVEPSMYNVCYVNVSRLDEIIDALHECRYFYNDLSTTTKGQVYTARYLVDNDYQIHIRIYNDGRLTGHYEARTEHPTDHLIGIGYRPLLRHEYTELRIILEKYLLG